MVINLRNVRWNNALSRKQSGYEDKMTVSEKSRWLILLVVSSALFLIVIDMTVL